MKPAWESKTPFFQIRGFLGRWSLVFFLWIVGITLEEYQSDLAWAEMQLKLNSREG